MTARKPIKRHGRRVKLTSEEEIAAKALEIEILSRFLLQHGSTPHSTLAGRLGLMAVAAVRGTLSLEQIDEELQRISMAIESGEAPGGSVTEIEP